jgi:hypothetical protein
MRGRRSVVGGRKKKKTFTTKAQRTLRGRDAKQKHAENTEERKVMTGNSPLLALGPP